MKATAQVPEQVLPAVAEEVTKNGWYYENDTWYCYKKGVPCTGWIRSAGVDYYLREDGSVMTGWAEVDGQKRLFSSTGAVLTGWVKDQNQTLYLDADSKPVTGWQLIEDQYYYFNEQGVLQDKYIGSALRQLRQLGLTVDKVKAGIAEENIPQE